VDNLDVNFKFERRECLFSTANAIAADFTGDKVDDFIITAIARRCQYYSAVILLERETHWSSTLCWQYQLAISQQDITHLCFAKVHRPMPTEMVQDCIVIKITCRHPLTKNLLVWLTLNEPSPFPCKISTCCGRNPQYLSCHRDLKSNAAASVVPCSRWYFSKVKGSVSALGRTEMVLPRREQIG